MRSQQGENWVERLNAVSSKYLMPLMAILFILYSTALNFTFLDNRVPTMQSVLALFILGIVGCNLLFNKDVSLLSWIKDNRLVLAYFAVRFLCLLKMGINGSMLRLLCVEAFYLLGICGCTLGKAHGSRFYLKCLVYFYLLLSALCLIAYAAMGRMDDPSLVFGSLYTPGGEKMNRAIFFSNPNAAGLMAGFMLVLCIIHVMKKGVDAKIVCFTAYNIFFLIHTECRSAEFGIIVVLLALAAVKIVPRLAGKRIAIAALVLMIATLVPLYAYVGFQESREHLSYTEQESMLNSLSTGRYAIWKICILTQPDALLLGHGSIALDQDFRKSWLEKEGADSDPWLRTDELGPHNGYLGMISCCGVLGFLFFVLALSKKILQAKYLRQNRYYLIMVFLFAVNCFESLLMLNRFFPLFYMLLLLELGEKEGAAAGASQGKEEGPSAGTPREGI